MKTAITLATLLLAPVVGISLAPDQIQEPVESCCAGEEVTAASLPSEGALGLELLEDMIGTWVMTDEAGNPTDQVMSVARKTAGGSVIMETMFPGQPDEMVTMYYTKGDHLMMTHYCALTNHPVLKASYDAESGMISFDCVGAGENFDFCKETQHMHEGRFMIDRKAASFGWRMMMANGEMSEDHNPTFKVVKLADASAEGVR